MSYEVEVKYRCVDHDRLRRALLASGAIEHPAAEQEDIYLRHPARDFALTHEALRLRRIGLENRVTYKGPRFPGPTKTREEIEITFVGGEAAYRGLARLLELLGFEPVAAVRKRRVSFVLGDSPRLIEVTLDSVDGLGEFAEIETQARDDSELPEAQAAVLELAGRLGLEELEPRSYLRMVLDSREGG